MASSTLIKQIAKLSLLNNASTKLMGVGAIDKRTIMTENEKNWIKARSIELVEKAKQERGPKIEIDPTQPQLYFEKSDELKTADERVKKIFSLEYARRSDYKRFEENLIKSKVQRLPIEEDSLEIQIAFHTMNIRRMARNIVEFNGRNRRVKFFLYRAMHRRDRLMLDLFYKDNKRFEWIKEFLNLNDYKLVEKYEYTRQTRYEKYISQVKAAAKEIRQKKLDALREEFERQKGAFFKERNAVLEKLKQEIIELGFDNLQFPQIPPPPTPAQQSNK